MNVTRALSTRLPGMKTGQFASIPAGILAARRDVWTFWRRTIEWAPAASDNLTLEDYDATDPGVLVDLDDAVWPLRIQRLEVLTAPLNNKLLEGGFCFVFSHHDDVLSTDRIDVGIHKDQITVVELGLHDDAVHPQDIGVLATFNRAGK